MIRFGTSPLKNYCLYLQSSCFCFYLTTYLPCIQIQHGHIIVPPGDFFSALPSGSVIGTGDMAQCRNRSSLVSGSPGRVPGTEIGSVDWMVRNLF